MGVLSGDHTKEASDLGLPFVAVGFLYELGYFRQRLDHSGWQEAIYPPLNPDEVALQPVPCDDERECRTISMPVGNREVYTQIWEVQAGRARLYLMDADLEENAPWDRQLTARLYGGDREMRIQQEILLGIGGVRVLRELDISPKVWHINEGHSAFMLLERVREYVSQGVSYDEAKERVKASTIFTTHTPVPAGSDEFPLWLVEKYFSHLWPQLNLDRDQFMDLARNQHSWGESFSMPILALRFSEYRNGVSELHGRVAREMWNFMWPESRAKDVPISHITNGVHTGTWLARRLRQIYDQYLGVEWRDRIDDPYIWENIDRIPDEELWEVRRHLKRKLVLYMRDRARLQWISNEVHPVQVVASGALLDPYALTIGFARRFATYKRANLILSDLERLLEIINQPNMPVQIIFAGKAHPADEPGKLLIQEVYRVVKRAEFGGQLVFLEDYDMNLARYLVQGVDIWLNTPRRPNEASGTSGQKAAINGVLNFSVLDGWWCEGYNGRNGWAIGEDKDYEDPDLQDAKDAISLYDLLANQIIPLYYNERSSDGLPGDWIKRMKESMRTLTPQFSMRRMVKEYAESLYLPVIIKQGKSGTPQE